MPTDAGRGNDGGAGPMDATIPMHTSADAAAAAMNNDAGTGAPTASDAGQSGPTDAAADAASVVPDSGAACGADLSNIGAGDFKIAFKLTTTMVGHASLLNQRAICDYSTFWDVHAWFPGAGTTHQGELIVETDDATHAQNYLSTTIPTVLNDGKSHTIGVARVAGKLVVTVDGSASAGVQSRAEFTALAPLKQGSDVCTPVDHRLDFVGTLSDVCLTR